MAGHSTSMSSTRSATGSSPSRLHGLDRYDFEQALTDEERDRDSLSASSAWASRPGGRVVQDTSRQGSRGSEDRLRNLGELYLAKSRYDDARKTYTAFVSLNPFHRSSPHFSMRVWRSTPRATSPAGSQQE